MSVAYCTKQIISEFEGASDGFGDGAVQEDHFQQGTEPYNHDGFDQQAGGGDGFDKWDDEEEDWEAQQRQQDQDGKNNDTLAPVMQSVDYTPGGMSVAIIAILIRLAAVLCAWFAIILQI